MARHDYDDDYHDDDAAFPVRCESCNVSYDNREHACPNCDSTSCSYDSDDAKHWNNHLRRTGRG